ncbi:SDR family NAD(P)-dependent oxidoreductase [Corallococcus exiguus]|uniref:SDR family NAD(P)-dependent oxidoreductase n=1 Tax=Corallococcus exiguus TaxID=83462 RepID=A0A7X5BSE8_9BACT|nr:SDR family NAD(P)-dependent oxidoreductase [Corallococcus exiguus]TNV59579.1 SDR family oxidoreductase [Corallococcus exiguus]
MTSGIQGLAIITGASTGIGAATARELARRGFHVLAGVRRDHDARAKPAVRRAGASHQRADRVGHRVGPARGSRGQGDRQGSDGAQTAHSLHRWPRSRAAMPGAHPARPDTRPPLCRRSASSLPQGEPLSTKTPLPLADRSALVTCAYPEPGRSILSASIRHGRFLASWMEAATASAQERGASEPRSRHEGTSSRAWSCLREMRYATPRLGSQQSQATTL